MERRASGEGGSYGTSPPGIGARSPRPAPASAEAPEIEVLLAGMRDGNREAAATFITRYEGRIRRRIRGKLSPSMRRIFDSHDILSTVGRRLDVYVRAGRLEAASQGQLWALVFRMANNAVVDKSRVFQRLKRVEGEDSPLAHELLRRFRDADRRAADGAQIELDRALGVLRDETDREILTLWLNGIEHNVIAVELNLEPPAVRKRWQRIKSRLQDRLGAEMTA